MKQPHETENTLYQPLRDENRSGVRPRASKALAIRLYLLTAVFLIIGAGASRMAAQENHSHMNMSQSRDQSDQRSQSNTLIKVVREATDRYQNVSAAEVAGYHLMFGCVSGDDAGAMGMHFVNMPLVMDGMLDATRPEIVIYEPLSNGRLHLIGADYLVLAADWHERNADPPQLMGQLFHLFDSPNRFGLPAFYTLHVWAWKENPTRAFVNWHSDVSCTGFNGELRQ